MIAFTAVVCMSYSSTLALPSEVRLESISKLVKAIKEGKKVRLVGDSIHFRQQVRSERKDCHGMMEHHFGSAAIIQDIRCPGLSGKAPQQYVFAIEQVILSHEDARNLADDYICLVMEVMICHIPYFKFLLNFIPQHLTDGYTAQMQTISVVVPLDAVHKNE
jgi:hypothetical protein